jgi:mRNA interferase MazF
MKPRRGEVWLVRFPFSDMSTTKLRPALVLAVHGHDVIFAGIFSRVIQIPGRKTWLILNQADTDFSRTGLKKTSVLKAEKIAVIHETVLVRRIGSFSHAMMRQVQRLLKLALLIP